jgi:hypothetical protein
LLFRDRELVPVIRTTIAGIRQFVDYLRGASTSTSCYFRGPYPPFDDRYIHRWDHRASRPRPVGLRILLAVPHFIVLFFILLAWCLTTIAAWFIILFTSSYPQGLYEFGVGALRWRIRVETYLLLMVDEYPPFSLT